MNLTSWCEMFGSYPSDSTLSSEIHQQGKHDQISQFHTKFSNRTSLICQTSNNVGLSFKNGVKMIFGFDGP